MKAILRKCKTEDFNYVSRVLDNYVSLTNDSRRKELLTQAESSADAKEALVELMDKQIRYFGSSDLAYLARSLFDSDGGVSASELIAEVCVKSKVKIKLGGSVESRLEKLVTAVVEKELLSKSPEELAKAFKEMGIEDIDREKVMEHLKSNGKVAILPIIFQILGPKVALGIIEVIIISIIAQIIGREAAKALVQEMVKRNPWLNALGPWMWALSAAWLAFDVQGPAYRKTVPICLYLGVVGLRDGPETPITDLAQKDD
ncbi:hypothetical protein GIW56_09450 [Pseudomonas gessardii]|uniref:Uncharacterized protein n=1 Tax=Pseudomonas gessardii TaxID=78544 RepID=A0ABS9F3V2_9PSED|nr:hypothetical protein [Pseudomonas gessardii]MCF4977739.1 hypothetical protein [Pseudomonas gessardii]MCF4992197.1 hypothetical protein [Pseudomonas gessardii]MCF5083710.1 hypothetical protein [Pseudomonas gessardii]MCF5098663.1 hypothetical protein [Pseudomonas gessardii]MCF5107063.1 hypothetical protein [Pseudomonas gessardii]